MAKDDANRSEPHTVSEGQASKDWPKQGDPLTDIEKQVVATGLLLAKDFITQGRFDRDVTIQMLAIVAKLGIRPEWDQAVKTLPPVRIVEM